MAPPSAKDFEPADIERALAGDAVAVRALVQAFMPIIHARVARSLLRRSPAGRDVYQEVTDITQEVLAALFADRGRALRGWDPARGLSLANFVGLVAERQLMSILRSGKRNPWMEDPTTSEQLAAKVGSADTLERRYYSREILCAVVGRLQERLSPLGWRLFELLIDQEQSVTEVCEATNMTTDAVYAWRSRLTRFARQIAEEVAAEA